MTAGAVLIAGKAMIWFALPLGLAAWELWSVTKLDSAEACDEE